MKEQVLVLLQDTPEVQEFIRSQKGKAVMRVVLLPGKDQNDIMKAFAAFRDAMGLHPPTAWWVGEGEPIQTIEGE